jgi:hypothetical protein
LSRLASSLLCRPAAANAAVSLLNQMPWAARAIYRTSRVDRPAALLCPTIDNCPPETLLEPGPGLAASRVRKAGR